MDDDQQAAGNGSRPSNGSPGGLECVAEFHGPMPTGVTVSRSGRVFVNFPRWGDAVDFTVAELRDGEAVAYPDAAINRDDLARAAETFVSVQSVVVDPLDRLWVLDTGNPLMAGTVPGGPKLVCIDLASDRVTRTIAFPPTVAGQGAYLNDVRFDLRRGREGVAYITDSSEAGPNGIVVVDLSSGESWRRLDDHPSTKACSPRDFVPAVGGRPFVRRDDGGMQLAAAMGADGIAISADGARLWYCPLGSRRLYSVATDALLDRRLGEDAVAATVVDEGDKPGAADGLESDAAGNVYATDYEHDAVMCRRPDGSWDAVVHDARLSWPDTLSLADDGHLYVTANQLHRQARFCDGRDERQRPYALYRVRVDAQPVRLR